MAVSAGHFSAMAGDILHDESVTQSEFARRVGCTRQNISKLVLAGKITKNDKGQLDFYKSLRAYEDNTDPSHHERLNKLSLQSESAAAQVPDQLALDVPQNTGDKFKQARATREQHSAALVGLKLAKEAGELIRAEKVQQDAFNLGRGLRDAMLSLPDRLAPVLAAEQDDRKVAQILEEEINKALNGFVEASAQHKLHAS